MPPDPTHPSKFRDRLSYPYVERAAIERAANSIAFDAKAGEEGVRKYAFGTGGGYPSERLLRQAEMVSDPALRLQTVRRHYSHTLSREAFYPDLTIEQLRGKEVIGSVEGESDG